MCLGGVGAAGLFTQATASVQVLQVTHRIERGEVLDADDVVVVTVGRLPDGAALPASERDAVVGKEALAELPAGSLVAPGSVGKSTLEPGMVVVGLRLAPGRIPAQALPVGAAVTLVPVPAGNAPLTDGATIRARVVTATATKPDGFLTIDVAVPGADAQRVAKLAALDQLSVVRETDR